MSLLRRIVIVGNLQNRRSISTSYLTLVKYRDESSSSSSDSDSSSDDDRKMKKPPIPKENSNPDAANKLHALLKSMVEEESRPIESKKQLDLAKPREKQRKISLDNREKKKETQEFGTKLFHAAKQAAEELRGDVKQTEIDLLARLLYKGKSVEEKNKEESISSSGESAQKDVKKLGNLTLNELLSEMKIDRIKPKQELSDLEFRADQVRTMLGKSRRKHILPEGSTPKVKSPSKSLLIGERVDLFKSEPLGIFQGFTGTEECTDIKLETWERCFNRELKLAISHPPTNIYEQMIQWTEKGMIWHFPIDNEQGLEEEKKVSFSEHVHLEQHIEGWCPNRGPIRHFMELVCIGLSKNPWLTVDEKLQHIYWYRDFFQEKAKVIKEIGAGEIKFEDNKDVTA